MAWTAKYAAKFTEDLIDQAPPQIALEFSPPRMVVPAPEGLRLRSGSSSPSRPRRSPPGLL